MRWLTIKRWFSGVQKQEEAEAIEHEQLMDDIRQALREWERAHCRFQYAVGEDEVDYAIFTLEAAEKRVAMLIKKAKRNELHALNLGKGWT
ncbi:DUF2508 family protein [Paenibacillus melissococcoides]|uniref:DUF2508 family protein n=1 Tax=Paenibacillus melissococcoides TaxID=2912268 RepID=A0ABN8UBX8_9BACL|nr:MULTISPECIES: DUF2508 family protein [Paenibacillus]MEB9892616.1 DUF2508 family protein [Bacillus cereus]CAH8247532.1 DUF2508 family protein [Paenibacillus melissococcoides]CAH8705269.1 DUF2508 family protein [Paenibacillus melissococcoides]CAH8714680.1 DUF2508 family protein [Paenibacillus melissococcoides]GIO80558.1 hypothetical protein J6TS7_41680 [Paenibacillus dendritiformis]